MSALDLRLSFAAARAAVAMACLAARLQGLPGQMLAGLCSATLRTFLEPMRERESGRSRAHFGLPERTALSIFWRCPWRARTLRAPSKPS